jgi:hypothetical protein
MKQKHLKYKAMNTNINLSNLSSMFSSEDSFRNAVYLACDILKHRNEYKELTKNSI